MYAAGGIGGMVMGDHKCALEPFRLHPSLRRFQINELRVADVVVGDDAGIFQGIAIKRKDAERRRFEREEHTGLNLSGARKPAGFRRNFEFGSTEIL
jgi:hypothetical protein